MDAMNAAPQMTYTEAADVTPPLTPTMEQQGPGLVMTEATGPCVKLEILHPKQGPIATHAVEEQINTTKVDNEYENIEDVIVDSGALEIDDIDKYHPDTLSPSQQRVHGNHSPIMTRSRTRDASESAHLIHYAMEQVSMKAGIKK